MVSSGAGSIHMQGSQSALVASQPSCLLNSRPVFHNVSEFLKRGPNFCLSFSGPDLIFIHMESSLYSLPCSPMEMGVEDPTYHWVQDRAGKVPAPPSYRVRSKQLGWALVP